MGIRGRCRDPRKRTVRVFEHKTLILELWITTKPIKIGKMSKHFCFFQVFFCLNRNKLFKIEITGSFVYFKIATIKLIFE